MISTSFDYEKPQTLEAALSLLVEHGGNAKLLAGGHSLIPLMKLQRLTTFFWQSTNLLIFLQGKTKPGEE